MSENNLEGCTCEHGPEAHTATGCFFEGCECTGRFVAPEWEPNLEQLAVLHYTHPLQADVGSPAAAITLGFEWAEHGEGQGLFLCRGDCLGDVDCGGVLWADAVEQDFAETGHVVHVPLPWPAAPGSEELASIEVWCCKNCNVEGSGAVFDVWVGRFYDIPARLLAYVHEARSHTYTGARRSMGERYPDEFSETSFVTLMLYRRTL